MDSYRSPPTGNDLGDGSEEAMEVDVDLHNGPEVVDFSAWGVTLVGDGIEDEAMEVDDDDLLNLEPSVEDRSHKVFVDDCTPQTHFTNGKVLLGTTAALSRCMSTCLQPICGKTGIITDPKIVGRDGQFEDGVHYKRVCPLGNGSFGTVTLNRTVLSKKLFVEKEIFGNFNIREVEIIASLQHVNIVKFLGFELKENKLPIIRLEYAGVNLLEHVKKTKVITDKEIYDLTKQGLCAIEYLDQHGIFNPDIKPENFCIQGDVLKMIDFGSCKTAQDGFDCACTVEYMAPEACMFLKSENRLPPNVIKSKKYHVYALALTALFMKKREHVMVHFALGGQSYENVDEIRLKILDFVVKDPNFVKRRTTLENWIPSMRWMLNVMLEGSPEKRPDAHEILNELTRIEQEQKPPPISSPGKMPIEESSSMVTQEMVVG